MKTATLLRWLLIAGIVSLLGLSWTMFVWILATSSSSSNGNGSGFGPFSNIPHNNMILRGSHSTGNNENINMIETEKQKERTIDLPFPPSIWSRPPTESAPVTQRVVNSLLSPTELAEARRLCGKFLYSSLARAVQVDGKVPSTTFVATGDIDAMWTRDSAVQMGLYVHRTEPTATSNANIKNTPSTNYAWLKLILEGAIRRQAFNIVQDVYANAYTRVWTDPSNLQLRERVIGRGGWVSTRNYEVDSGAYFLQQIYDHYYYHGGSSVVGGASQQQPHVLQESIILEAVRILIDTYIVEQHHEEQSPYRYLELPRNGKGVRTNYTGLTWTGFRPSDDGCKYPYLIPANIHLAGSLQRLLKLNQAIWQCPILHDKATKLLNDLERGIREHGIVTTPDGVKVYAYEVDGLGGVLHDFDDANVPSLLSIPLLGWTNYDRQIYANTRERLLSPTYNKFYYKGKALEGIGSPHTPPQYVWPMALSIQALTLSAMAADEHSLESLPIPTVEERANELARQLKQSLQAACNDDAHESVSSTLGCPRFTRPWFEWSNALFVVLVETATGQSCQHEADARSQQKLVYNATRDGSNPYFFSNKYKSDPRVAGNYQGISAQVKFVG